MTINQFMCVIYLSTCTEIVRALHSDLGLHKQLSRTAKHCHLHILARGRRGRPGVVPQVGAAFRQPEPPLHHLRLLRQLLHLLQETRHPLLLPHNSEVNS